MKNFDYLEKNFSEVRADIAALEEQYQRHITLVCVTKSGSDEELLALFSLGAEAMGENRPQELKRRAELLYANQLFPELHEIGTLQTNKVKMIAERVTLIHSLDKLSLAEEINKQAKKFGRKIPVLIEINSAEEEQKSGILPKDAERFYESIADLDGITVKGLMTMGPVCECPEEIRKYFRSTKALFDKMNSQYGFGEEPVLSMGMSDSYTVAIEEGSTLVRVGRKLFIK